MVLEPPRVKLSGHQPALGAALKVVKDIQLFEKWHDRGDDAMTGEQLAELVSCDPILLGQSLAFDKAASSNMATYYGILMSTQIYTSGAKIPLTVQIACFAI